MIKFLVPSWIFIRKFSDVMSKKSFYAPSIGQIGMLSSSMIPGFAPSNQIIAFSVISLLCLYLAERLVNLSYPPMLISEVRNYFDELKNFTASIKSALKDMSEIEEIWRQKLEVMSIALTADTELKGQLSDLRSKSFLFSDITEYEAFFVDICDPRKQIELNKENPWIRATCFLLLLAGLTCLVASGMLVIHELRK